LGQISSFHWWTDELPGYYVGREKEHVESKLVVSKKNASKMPKNM
jgi:hypothetical protein